VLQAAAQALIPPPGPGPWSTLAGFRTNAARRLQVAVEIGEVVHLVDLEGREPELQPVTIGGERLLFDHGQAWRFDEPRYGLSGAAGVGDGELRSPMPGRIVSVAVQAGQTVVKGQVLVMLEAMKMELRITAEFDGKVEALDVHVGDQVAEGALLGRVAKA
jgi:acetyl/propionyl-CoA carboxylase alpha subunit